MIFGKLLDGLKHSYILSSSQFFKVGCPSNFFAQEIIHYIISGIRKLPKIWEHIEDYYKQGNIQETDI